MKRTTLMMTSAFFLASSGAMLAATAGEASLTTYRAAEAATEVVRGEIERVSPDDKEFTLRVAEEPEALDATSITFKVNDTTQYTLDGKRSTMEEAMKVDRRATVAHEEKVAIKVDVWSAKSPS